MKKFLITGIGVLFILCILFFTTYSNNRVSAGNEITEFEYEYYYNDNNNTGDVDMKGKQSLVSDSGDVRQKGRQDRVKDDSKESKQSRVRDDDKEIKRSKAKDDGEEIKQGKAKDDGGEIKQGKTKDDNEENRHDNAISLDIEPDSISVFVNKEYALPESYIPENLVIPNIRFYGGGDNEKNKLRQEAAESLEKMFDEAMDDNIVLYGVSGYRSYARQKEIYDKNVRMRGSRATNKVSAAPGHSEHQTGLAMDISSKSLGGALTESFGDTPEGQWVAENCYQYGFIIRYPENTEQITGYSYEPWHLRYVGNEIAEYIHKENITLEEYYGYTLDEYYLDNIISDSGVND